MDELQKELLAILRELKAGASPAFAELVTQRSSYCSVSAWGCAALVALSLLGLVVALRCIAIANRENSEGWGITGVVAGVPSLMGLIISGVNCVSYAAEAAAPLGRVLEMLR